jgi:uncharacterized protein YbaP (TraB family)
MYWQFPKTNLRILGSMHLIPANNSGLPNWAIEAFEWAEVLVFESDPPTILPLVQAPAPTDLQQTLTPQAWKTLHGLWPKTGQLPPIESVRPWAALLFSSVFAQRVAQGIEAQLMQWAVEQSKPVLFLETAEEVASAFDSAPADEIRQALELLAANLSAPQRSIEAMYKAWLLADLPGLYAAASQSPTFQLTGLKSAVLTRRNQQWAPAIRQLLQSPKRTLIAVGALHLFGQGNAIEQTGCDVQPISI